LAAFGNLADASGDDAVRLPASDVEPGEADRATTGGMQAGQGVQQGGFTRAIAADHRDQFSNLDG
jgi:hypothetical protein